MGRLQVGVLLVLLLLSQIAHGQDSGPAQFAPANVSITNMSITPSNASVNSIVKLYLTATNNGGLASGPLTFAVKVYSEANYTYRYAAPALSPGQSYELTITLSNATRIPGSYRVVVNAYYNASNVTVTTPTSTVLYEALNSSSNPNPYYTPAARLPDVLINSLPLFDSFVNGTSSLSEIDLQNTGNKPLSVSLSVPKQSSEYASLYGANLYLNPNSTVGIEMLLNPNQNLSIGTYTFPLNVSVNYQNRSRIVQTYYPTIVILNNQTNGLFTTKEINIVNYRSASATIMFTNPSENSTLTNVTYYTYLPPQAVKSASQINATGIPNNITYSNGVYTIKWNVGTMPPDQVTYGYYSLQDLSDISMLSNTVTVLVSPSKPPASSILRMVSPVVQAISTNSTETVNVSAVYTGLRPQQLLITLTAPTGVTVYNEAQNVSVEPNQFITRSFTIRSDSSPGTFILNLYASTSGANFSYSIPMIVTQGASPPASSGGLLQLLGILISQNIVIISLLILIVLIILAARALRRRPRYDEDREERLLKIKKGIDQESVEDLDA